MIPTATKQTVHLDFGVRAETTMTISEDAADAAFVLQTMTDMYSVKPLAVIREISTNAWDSHIAAGQTRPIAVTLPVTGDTNPTFVVQDWGVGLDADDLENIYAKFGKSTKRKSESATGMLGLGCKAPLTYCLSFTVVGVKNGVKTVAVVTKNERGIGTIKVLDQLVVDEPNGVTVTVPVPPGDVAEFNGHANNFFRFWRGDVLVNGEPPTQIEPVLELDPDIFVINDDGRGRHSDGRSSIIVQGNVPYPYPTKPGLPRTVTWAPVGSVNFVPNREALLFDALTDDTVSKIQEHIKNLLDRIVSFEVDGANSTYERWLAIMRLKNALPYEYKHKSLGISWKESRLSKGKTLWVVNNDTASKDDRIHEQYLKPRYGTPYTFVTDFPYKGVSARHKAMVRAAGIEQPYVLVQEKPGVLLDGFPGRSWNSIPELPKAIRERAIADEVKTSGPRQETQYDFYIKGEYRSLTQYDGDLPLLWTEHNDSVNASSLSEMFQVAVVRAKYAQKDRVQRLHPTFVPNWQDHVNGEIKVLARRLTKSDHRYLDSQKWERNLSHYFGDVHKKVKDPALRKHMNLTKSEHLERLLKIQGAFGSRVGGDHTDLWQKLLTVRGSGREVEKPHEGHPIRVSYPMLYEMDRYSNTSFMKVSVDDWLIYLNGKYAAIKKAAKNTDDATDDTAEAA